MVGEGGSSREYKLELYRSDKHAVVSSMSNWRDSFQHVVSKHYEYIACIEASHMNVVL